MVTDLAQTSQQSTRSRGGSETTNSGSELCKSWQLRNSSVFNVVSDSRQFCMPRLTGVFVYRCIWWLPKDNWYPLLPWLSHTSTFLKIILNGWWSTIVYRQSTKDNKMPIGPEVKQLIVQDGSRFGQSINISCGFVWVRSYSYLNTTEMPGNWTNRL